MYSRHADHSFFSGQYAAWLAEDSVYELAIAAG